MIKLKSTIQKIKKINIKTINGVKKCEGMVKISLKIFNLEETTYAFVVHEGDFDDDFLIGLDCIKKFKLIQNENLEILQKIPDFSGDKENNIKVEKTLPGYSGKEEDKKIERKIPDS